MDAYDVHVMARSGALTPEQQLKVLARIWGEDGEGGFVFLPWIPGWCKNKEDRRANWKEGEAYEWPHDRDKILAHIERHQTDDLYFSVNVFLQDSRIIQHIGESRVLYADLDEVDPRTDIDPEMQPSIAWESSPGRFQGVWTMSSMEWEASMPGGLNHRLTAAIGADPSGWDATQVLRVPGKPNYKFDYKDEDGRPVPGRLMWVRQKQYKWSFFDERLAPVKTYDTGVDVEESEVDQIDRHEVWSRVRMRCSHTVRNYMGMRAREIDPDEFDRSEVLWQIERDLADAGCTVAEIMSLVRGTPWNKYEGRRNELAQLRAEALKAIGVAEDDKEEKPLEQAVYDGSRPTIENLPTLAVLSEASIPRPHWLVRKIWTRGSVGFIAGEPKSYKSYFALDMAISLATGTPFLNDVQYACPKSRVIYIQEEDSLPLVFHRAGQIIEGKAPERHWHGQMTLDVTTPGGGVAGRSGTISDVLWTPPDPVDSLAMLVRKGFVASDPAWQSWLAEMIDEWGAEMVIIDTLGTTNGGIDINDSVTMNQHILNPLRTISEHTGAAIAFVHHNKKGEGGGKARSGQQMLGSTALHAWVESALYVQSKEQLTGQPATVKLERENKLAEDLKLTIKIPTMWTAKGHEEGDRQLWEPTVSEGWSETAQSEPIREEEKRGGLPAGLKIAEWIRDEMGHGWHSIDAVVKAHPQNKTSLTRQISRAVSNEVILRDGDRIRYNSDYD